MGEFTIYDAYNVMSALTLGSLILNLILGVKLSSLKDKISRSYNNEL